MMTHKITLRTAEEIEKLRTNNMLVSRTLAALAGMIRPGVRTIELDRFAESFIRDHGAVPGFKGYEGFPYTLCVSVNDVVVHGFPSEYVLREGDIVSVDCGTIKDGFYGDSAFTFAVGEISPENRQLLDVTRKSLELGIAEAVSGNRVGDIGAAVQDYSESFGYGVVRELVGHGLGTTMHEYPEVPNYGRRGHGVLLRPGLCICIEPMVTMGSHSVYQDRDGWSVRTLDGSNAAHFEKAIVVSDRGAAEELTDFAIIDEAVSKSLA